MPLFSFTYPLLVNPGFSNRTICKITESNIKPIPQKNPGCNSLFSLKKISKKQK